MYHEDYIVCANLNVYCSSYGGSVCRNWIYVFYEVYFPFIFYTILIK